MQNRKKKKSFVIYLPVFGCFSTGLIYVAVGVIAILSFLKLKQGGADEGSLVVFLHDYALGKGIIWIILSGTVCYIIWRIYESITDPYDYGKKAKGIAMRVGVALSTIPDALIAYTIIRILLGRGNLPENGQPEEQRQLVSHLLQEPGGNALIISLGVIISLTAIVQLFYGVTRGYRERLAMEHLGPVLKSLIHSLAWTGYLARAIIVGIIGFFFLKAGVLEEALHIVNTDKAFDFIGDEVGHGYFILVAVGTICYGFFMFALGVAYDADKK